MKSKILQMYTKMPCRVSSQVIESILNEEAFRVGNSVDRILYLLMIRKKIPVDVKIRRERISQEQKVCLVDAESSQETEEDLEYHDPAFILSIHFSSL